MKLPEELMFIKNGRMKQHETDTRLDGKTTVISGSTSGIGLSAVERFAKYGSNIVMVCRNEEKALPIKTRIEQEHNVQVQIFIADFSDFDSVKAAANRINKEVDKIDILINSAGLHSTSKKFNKDGLELCFSVNHLGTFLFTVLLLDKMKENPSRIIQVNSEGHRFGGVKPQDLNFKKRLYTGLRSYGQSKTAQLMTVFELSKRLQNSNITINAMHPGAVKTNIGSNNGLLYRLFLKYVTGITLKDVSISANALHYLAASDELDNRSGEFFNLTIKEIPARHVFKDQISKQVWDLSFELTGLSEESVTI